jgi:DNA-directed RNA polymerase I, II, and III subunit RPABC2
MPNKKKENITKDVPINKIEDETDDKESVSTDSDIVSGTFSDLNNEEQDQEDEESVDSEVESIELEPEIAEEEAEAEADLEEAEAEVEEEKVVSKKKAVKKTVVINNDCLYNNIDFEEDYAEKEEQVDSSNRITMNRLTKYEKVRIIGIRTNQIMTGANILIKGIEGKTPSEIAELELKYNMVPFKIKRKLPNGKFEIWKLSELEK